MKSVYKYIILVVVSCVLSIGIYKYADRANKIDVKLSLIDEQYNLEQTFLGDTNYTFENPKIIVNPYNISPLTALIVFETKDLSSVTATIHGKDSNTTFENTFKPAKIHLLPIYGLYAGENTVTLTLNGVSKDFKITTDPLPEDIAHATINKLDRDKLNNDLYFFTPSSDGYTVAYDVNGDVRWYLSENFVWDISRLNNGHILLSSNRVLNQPYYTTGLMEMDLLGKVYYEYVIPGGYHHDYFEMPDGNLLVASNDFENQTVEDYIVEIDRATGNVVKKWDLKDILPQDSGTNVNATDFDWFHNNSVWYDAKTNSITLSGRHQDAIVNINYESGELNWIIGSSDGWSDEYKKYFFTPTDNLEWQWGQHAAMMLPNGNIFVFDNGNNRSKTEENAVTADNNYSRGVIYNINTTDMTINQVWQYGKDRGASFYSPYISDVDYLDNNHYLISSGGNSSKDGTYLNTPAGLTDADKLTSTTVEILNDQVIFEMSLNTNTYRAEKMSLYSNDDYVPGKGSILGSLDETKVDGHKLFTISRDLPDTIRNKYEIYVYQDEDRLIVDGRFKKSDDIKIILSSVFEKRVYNFKIAKRPYTAMCIDVFNEEENENGIFVTKYINSTGLSDKYYIYMSINGKLYSLDQYVIF